MKSALCGSLLAFASLTAAEAVWHRGKRVAGKLDAYSPE
jgi:hypothetical protein